MSFVPFKRKIMLASWHTFFYTALLRCHRFFGALCRPLATLGFSAFLASLARNVSNYVEQRFTFAEKPQGPYRLLVHGRVQHAVDDTIEKRIIPFENAKDGIQADGLEVESEKNKVVL